MINLTNLVKEYKETKSEVKLNTILKTMHHIITKKAQYVFYRKYYPLSLYQKCKSCQECKLKKCKKCNKCRCEKGAFNLAEKNLCDYMDVEQDLTMEILRLIENFDVRKNFETYLFSTLWNWRPSFLNRDMIKQIHSQSLYEENEDGEYKEVELPAPDKKYAEALKVQLAEFLKVCNNEIERKVILNLLSNKMLNQSEIAIKLGITRQAVSKIMLKLKKRIKKKLTFADF
jgi:RNA polymerase sigma factor (sigma-70 family)